MKTLIIIAVLLIAGCSTTQKAKFHARKADKYLSHIERDLEKGNAHIEKASRLLGIGPNGTDMILIPGPSLSSPIIRINKP